MKHNLPQRDVTKGSVIPESVGSAEPTREELHDGLLEIVVAKIQELPLKEAVKYYKTLSIQTLESGIAYGKSVKAMEEHSQS